VAGQGRLNLQHSLGGVVLWFRENFRAEFGCGIATGGDHDATLVEVLVGVQRRAAVAIGRG